MTTKTRKISKPALPAVKIIGRMAFYDDNGKRMIRRHELEASAVQDFYNKHGESPFFAGFDVGADGWGGTWCNDAREAISFSENLRKAIEATR